MKYFRFMGFFSCYLSVFLILLSPPPALYGQALFFGDHYTSGQSVQGVAELGGVPKMIEIIAKSKGKDLSTRTVTGKNWSFLLGQPETDEALHAQKWKWVILQAPGTDPTHVGNAGKFKSDGLAFYKTIRHLSHDSKVVLYQTWARAAGDKFYAPKSTSDTFLSPAEMTAELADNYRSLSKELEDHEDVELGIKVPVAPVGAAFARSLELHPDIKLYAPDKDQANENGFYLAALVIYATLFKDSPMGATAEFRGIKLDSRTAGKLQAVAAEITLSSR